MGDDRQAGPTSQRVEARVGCQWHTVGERKAARRGLSWAAARAAGPRKREASWASALDWAAYWKGAMAVKGAGHERRKAEQAAAGLGLSGSRKNQSRPEGEEGRVRFSSFLFFSFILFQNQFQIISKAFEIMLNFGQNHSYKKTQMH